MPHYLGLDIGTSGTKAIVIDEMGTIVGRGLVEYPLLTPRPLWAEQHPADWWRGACEATKAAIADAGVGPSTISGIGLTWQMHGSVFLDDADKVIRPAILWCDQRTAAQCEWNTKKVGAERVLRAFAWRNGFDTHQAVRGNPSTQELTVYEFKLA